MTHDPIDWQAGLPGPCESTVRENVARAIFEPSLWLACAAFHAALRFPRLTVAVLTPVATMAKLLPPRNSDDRMPV